MSENKVLVGVLFALGLLLGMVLLLEAGRNLGQRRAKRDGEDARAGLGAIEGAIFALLGLLIAFTFSGAASRFDTRRELIIQETNAIGTAWLRLDVVEPTARAALRDLLRQYLDQRLDTYRLAHDLDRAFAQLAQSQQTQQRIWDAAIAAAHADPNRTVVVSLLPALNQMFDVATRRTLVLRMHPPAIVFIMLGTCALLAALMAGFSMSRGTRSWTHIFVFATVMAGAVYIIMDMEYPRMGIVRVQSFDQALVELRRSME